MAIRFWKGASKLEEVEAAIDDPASLGNILLKRGWVTTEQLTNAIQHQLTAAPPLGEILVEMRAITPEQLEDALYEQRRMRGETTNQEDVSRQLTRQAAHMRQVSEGLDEIAGISNAIALKLSGKTK